MTNSTVVPVTLSPFDRAYSQLVASGKYNPKRLASARLLCLDPRTRFGNAAGCVVVPRSKDEFLFFKNDDRVSPCNCENSKYVTDRCKHRTCAELVFLTAELEGTAPGHLPASLLAAREQAQQALKAVVYPDAEAQPAKKSRKPKYDEDSAEALREWRKDVAHLSTSELIHRAGAERALEEEWGI